MTDATALDDRIATSAIANSSAAATSIATSIANSSAAATSDDLKAAFREHAVGVALIAATTPSGPVGLTASSVASVAVDPLALSFSVTRATGSAGALLRAGSVVVHLLADHHVGVARAFARSGGPRFTREQGWTHLPTGEPLLADARAALRCRIMHTVPVGGSSLVVAEVLEVRFGPAAPPLVYHDRRYLGLDPGMPGL